MLSSENDRNLEKHLNKEDRIDVILMDLSKAFDTINQSLLLAKLEASGFSTNSLKLIQNFLCNRFQRTKVIGPFRDWIEILAGVLQSFFLGTLLLNIFLNDVFLFVANSNLCNYAIDNILYAINKKLHVVKSYYKANFAFMQRWFYENHIVLNPGKCHYMLQYRQP